MASITKAKEPLTGFSFDWSKPGMALRKMVSALIGITAVVVLFRIALNTVIPGVLETGGSALSAVDDAGNAVTGGTEVF